jgi:hypothetical protein
MLKGSLVVLLWFVIHIFVFTKAVSIVWPHNARIAGIRNGTFPIDVTPTLPLIAWVLIYGLPSVIVGSLMLLYRIGTRETT